AAQGADDAAVGGKFRDGHWHGAELATSERVRQAREFFDTANRPFYQSETPHPACGHLLPAGEKEKFPRDEKPGLKPWTISVRTSGAKKFNSICRGAFGSGFQCG